MSRTVLATDVPLVFGGLTTTVAAVLRQDDPLMLAVEHVPDPGEGPEPPERISLSLVAYGLVPGEGNVYVKDWSEHQGLTASLVAAGLVEVVAEAIVGPFSTLAFEVKVL